MFGDAARLARNDGYYHAYVSRGNDKFVGPSAILEFLRREHADRSTQCPPHVVAVYERGLFARIASCVRAVPDERWIYRDRPARALHRRPGEAGWALLQPEIGAALTVYLIELLAACGLRELLLVTSAGAVREDLALGQSFDIAGGWMATVEVAAAPTEASPAVRGRIAAAAQRAGMPTPTPVHTLSSDRFFQREPRFWTHNGHDPDVVEMEAAASLAVGVECGVDVGGVGYIADLLHRPRWERDADHYHPEARLRLVDLVAAYVDEVATVRPADRGDRDT